MKILRRDYTFRDLYFFRKSIFIFLSSPRKIFNFLLVKISLFLRLKKCLGSPIHLVIEPTARCNYKCLKCRRFSDEYKDEGFIFKDKDMPFDFYKYILDDIGKTLLTLRLWHYGEPLMCNDIFRMIKYAKKKGVVVVLSSNLFFLNERNAKKLIQSGLDYLIVSFDGASEYTYNLHHGRNYFNKVVKNIHNLIELKKSQGLFFPFVELQFVVTRENQEELEKVKTLSNKLGVDRLVYQKIYVNKGVFSESKGFIADNNILPENKHFWIDMQKVKAINFCSVPWEEALIRYSGLVLPCCEDLSYSQKFGMLFLGRRYLSFGELWNGSLYRNFRHKVASSIDKIGVCCSCHKRNNSSISEVQ